MAWMHCSIQHGCLVQQHCCATGRRQWRRPEVVMLNVRCMPLTKNTTSWHCMIEDPGSNTGRHIQTDTRHRPGALPYYKPIKLDSTVVVPVALTTARDSTIKLAH